MGSRELRSSVVFPFFFCGIWDMSETSFFFVCSPEFFADFFCVAFTVFPAPVSQ